MDTKKAKQRITLALETCGMRGRFTVRDVAETAATEIKWDDLSSADQREALLTFLTREARAQMKAPLRDDIKEEYFRQLPERYWPMVERLTKTICVSGGGAAPYHVLTLYASDEEWEAFLGMADLMERKIAAAKDSARDIRDLLKVEGVESLYQLFTGRRVARAPFPKGAQFDGAEAAKAHPTTPAE